MQETGPNIRILLLSLFAVAFLVVLAFLIFKYLPQYLPEREEARKFQAPTTTQTNPFELNPFSEEATYENPFSTPSSESEYQNPFENLR